MFLGRCDEQLSGVFGVADRSLGIEAEHRGQVQGVGPMGEGFLELPVDAEPSQGSGLAAQAGLGEVDGAAIRRNAVPAVRSYSVNGARFTT